MAQYHVKLLRNLCRIPFKPIVLFCQYTWLCRDHRRGKLVKRWLKLLKNGWRPHSICNMFCFGQCRISYYAEVITMSYHNCIDLIWFRLGSRKRIFHDFTHLSRIISNFRSVFPCQLLLQHYEMILCNVHTVYWLL